MDLLNRFNVNLFIDILPDGILSILSNQYKLINDLVYYDNITMNKFQVIIDMNYGDIFYHYMLIRYLQFPKYIKDKSSKILNEYINRLNMFSY